MAVPQGPAQGENNTKKKTENGLLINRTNKIREKWSGNCRATCRSKAWLKRTMRSPFHKASNQTSTAGGTALFSAKITDHLNNSTRQKTYGFPNKPQGRISLRNGSNFLDYDPNLTSNSTNPRRQSIR